MTKRTEPKAPNVRSHEGTSLYSGYSIDVARTPQNDAILVQTHPILFEAGLSGLIMAAMLFLCLCDWFFWPPSDSLLHKTLTSPTTSGYFVYASFMTIAGTVIWLSGVSFLLTAFPRRFLIQNHSIHFSGVPGLSMRIPSNDMEAIYLLTSYSNKIGWSCHVAFGIIQQGQMRFLVVNWAQVCTRRELIQHRGEEGQEQWLVEVHKPLASLLGRLIEKPVKFQRVRPFFQRNPRWYWR